MVHARFSRLTPVSTLRLCVTISNVTELARHPFLVPPHLIRAELDGHPAAYEAFRRSRVIWIFAVRDERIDAGSATGRSLRRLKAIRIAEACRDWSTRHLSMDGYRPYVDGLEELQTAPARPRRGRRSSLRGYNADRHIVERMTNQGWLKRFKSRNEACVALQDELVWRGLLELLATTPVPGRAARQRFDELVTLGVLVDPFTPPARKQARRKPIFDLSSKRRWL